MTNQLYPSFKALLLNGDIDLAADDIKVALVDTNDVAFSTSHDFLNDVSASVVATSGNLASKTTTGGVFDAADITFTGVTGDVSEALILYKDTGSAATSPLICFIDSATGLPITPNSGNVVVAWHASGIFAL